MRLESLIMVRHGESTGNVASAAAVRSGAEEMGIPEREADVPLSEFGRAQAAALGDWLAGLPETERPTAVLSSPYLRASETARIALEALPGEARQALTAAPPQGGSAPGIRLDKRLRDRDVGALYGLTPRGVMARFPEEAERRQRLGKFYYRPPGGEAWTDVALRLRVLLADLDRNHPGGRLLLCAHDAVIVLARYILCGLSEADILEIEKTPIKNCSVSRWQAVDGAPRLVAYNETSHLTALG